MSLGDLGNIMKQAQQLQERLSQVQETVARRTVEAAAGGGMVRVVVNGKHELLSLTIDPSVLKEDVELIQDLVLAAVNEGIRSAQQMVAEEMTKATGGLKIPASADHGMAYTPSMNRLIQELSKLPGIGEKTAARLAFHVLRADRSFAIGLADALRALKEHTRLCSTCNGLTETDPCPICSDSQRADDIICVVEDPADLIAIERSKGIRGRYHVLQGAISPLDGVGPEDLQIKGLLDRLRGDRVREVILATNPTVEGEATALYLARLIKPLGVRVTRIAHGIPMGGDVEYADVVTLGRALDGRRDMWSSPALGTLLFVLLVPGNVIVVIPYLLTGWKLSPPFFGWRGLRWIGVALIVAALPLFVDFAIRFVREGRGTPAPIAPTAVLVVGGPYRFVRNPGYVAVIALILGQALTFGSTRLLMYAVVLAVGFHLFVLWNEEPTLRQRFGSQYERYCQLVPRWLPRLTPATFEPRDR